MPDPTPDIALLEAAARAAAYGLGALCWTAWDPLTDDGDCGRLEAACLIDVNWSDDAVEALAPLGESVIEEFADHGGDRNAARRYASVRAAAALAKEEGNV